MIKQVFTELDAWAVKKNIEFIHEGLMPIKPCYIKVLGQEALIEANIDLNLSATMDVDVYSNYEYSIKAKFEELLNIKGKILDPDGEKIWMPKETEYQEIFKGSVINGYIAKVEYVLISKALKAPEKNKILLIEYLAKGPSKLFFDLVRKYKVKLEIFIK